MEHQLFGLARGDWCGSMWF